MAQSDDGIDGSPAAWSALRGVGRRAGAAAAGALIGSSICEARAAGSSSSSRQNQQQSAGRVKHPVVTFATANSSPLLPRTFSTSSLLAAGCNSAVSSSKNCSCSQGPRAKVVNSQFCLHWLVFLEMTVCGFVSSSCKNSFHSFELPFYPGRTLESVGWGGWRRDFGCCLLLLGKLLPLLAAAAACCCYKGLAAEAAPSARRETKNFTGHRTQKS